MSDVNRVNIDKHKRMASIYGVRRHVKIELIRIASDYYFIQDAQVIDLPKEREK